jgi:hypothetical protein
MLGPADVFRRTDYSPTRPDAAEMLFDFESEVGPSIGEEIEILADHHDQGSSPMTSSKKRSVWFSLHRARETEVGGLFGPGAVRAGTATSSGLRQASQDHS